MTFSSRGFFWSVLTKFTPISSSASKHNPFWSLSSRSWFWVLIFTMSVASVSVFASLQLWGKINNSPPSQIKPLSSMHRFLTSGFQFTLVVSKQVVSSFSRLNSVLCILVSCVSLSPILLFSASGSVLIILFVGTISVDVFISSFNFLILISVSLSIDSAFTETSILFCSSESSIWMKLEFISPPLPDSFSFAGELVSLTPGTCRLLWNCELVSSSSFWGDRIQFIIFCSSEHSSIIKLSTVIFSESPFSLNGFSVPITFSQLANFDIMSLICSSDLAQSFLGLEILSDSENLPGLISKSSKSGKSSSSVNSSFIFSSSFNSLSSLPSFAFSESIWISVREKIAFSPTHADLLPLFKPVSDMQPCNAWNLLSALQSVSVLECLILEADNCCLLSMTCVGSTILMRLLK